MTLEPRQAAAQSRDHVVICGANALASRMAEELTARYGLSVIAIAPSAASGHAARMAAMPGVRVLERAEPTFDAFLAADCWQRAAWPSCAASARRHDS